MTIHIERLKLMSTMLREVAAGTWKPTKLPENTVVATVLKKEGARFDLEDWIEPEPEFEKHCGYSACAVGHACLDERFELTLSMDKGGQCGHPMFEEADQRTKSWPAVRRYFGLGMDDAYYLFSEYDYTEKDLPVNDPAVVADRIDAFIAHRE